MDTQPANRIWQPTQPQHYTTREKIPLSRQLLKMGTRWPETCWATYKEQLISSREECSTTCYELPNGHTTSQQDLTAYTATALHHTWKILISRQLLKMGTRWPETYWATYKEQLLRSREVRSTTCYVLPNGHTTSQQDLTAYTATALHHTWKNTTKPSAPEDGHKVARNMLSNL